MYVHKIDPVLSEYLQSFSTYFFSGKIFEATLVNHQRISSQVSTN